MHSKSKETVQIDTPKVIVFCVDTRVLGQNLEAYSLNLFNLKIQLKNFVNLLSQKIRNDDNIYTSLISIKNTPESILKPCRFDLTSLHQSINKLELSDYISTTNPEKDVFGAILKYIERISTLSCTSGYSSSMRHRVIYITPECPVLSDQLKEKLSKLDEIGVIVDILLLKLIDSNDIISSPLSNEVTLSLFARQLFYLNVQQIESYPLSIERFFKHCLNNIFSQLNGLSHISIKIGYDGQSLSQSTYSQSSNPGLYNPLEHGDLTILTIYCSITKSLLEYPTIKSGNICKCHKALTVEGSSGLVSKGKNYCTISGHLDEKELNGSVIKLGNHVMMTKMPKGKDLLNYLNVIKRVPIQTMTETTLFGPSYILTYKAEYSTMDWEQAKRNKQLFLGLCQYLLQRMEVLITKTNLNVTDGSIEGLMRYYVLMPSTSGNAILLQAIAVAEQVLPFDHLDTENEEVPGHIVSIIDAALSQVPCQNFNPFEFECGYHEMCDECVNNAYYVQTDNTPKEQKKSSNKRTILTITSSGVKYTN